MRRWLWLFVSLAVAIVAAVMLAPHVASLGARFESIRPGMVRADVEERMGDPVGERHSHLTKQPEVNVDMLIWLDTDMTNYGVIVGPDGRVIFKVRRARGQEWKKVAMSD
jgi:hypothetical protein